MSKCHASFSDELELDSHWSLYVQLLLSGKQCSRAWATRKRSLKSKGVSDHELNNLEQPCSYLDVQQRSEKGKSAKGNGKQKSSKGKDVSLTPIEDAEKERKKMEREIGEFVNAMLSKKSVLQRY